MKILRDNESELAVGEDSVLLRAIGAGAIIFLLLGAGFYFLQEDPPMARVKGMFAGAGVLGVMFLAFYERNLFIFNKVSQWVQWTKWRAFRRKSGQLSFGQIQNVVLQSQPGSSSSSPIYRIALLTHEGEVPLTVTYDGDGNKKIIAERIRDLLKKSPEKTVLDSVTEAVRRGDTIEAVRMLRHEKGLSGTEAKNFVEDIKKEISNAQE